MKVFLHEIKDIESELHFTQKDPWIAEAVARLDEKLEDHPGGIPAPPRASRLSAERPIEAHFVLRRIDEVYEISGTIETAVELVCSRCATPYVQSTSPEFNVLYCKDPSMAGIAHLDRGNPKGQNHGYARHAASGMDETDVGKDFDITYISTDFIDLAEVATEQLQLQLPFQPLCKVDCKGICAQCGADQNVGRCACAKLAKETPFAALRGIKFKEN